MEEATLKKDTIYGLSSPTQTMDAFHEIGQKTLAHILKLSSHPLERKTLKTWGINSAAELIGKAPQSLRRLEKANAIPEAQIDEKGKRFYTLSDINTIREKVGTLYKRPSNSKAIILPVTNFKGGVSKTTTSVLLAQKCAIEGLRVLIIDLDPQATSTLLFGFIPDLHLYENDTIASSLIDDPQDITRVIKKTYFDGIDIIPGSSDLQQVELILPNKEQSNYEKLGSSVNRLKNALSLIKENYDVIIIDCGPNLGALTINAIAAANGMLVPIPPSMPDFGSFIRLTKALSLLFSKTNPDLEFFRILLSKHKGTNAANQLDAVMREKFGSYILVNHMVESTEIDNTANALCSIYEKPFGITKTYRRAIDAANLVNNEIISAFKEIWDTQSHNANNLTLESLENANV